MIQVLAASPPAINSSMNTSSVPYTAVPQPHHAGQHSGTPGIGEHPTAACEICSECSLTTTTGMGRGAASSADRERPGTGCQLFCYYLAALQQYA